MKRAIILSAFVILGALSGPQVSPGDVEPPISATRSCHGADWFCVFLPVVVRG